ncbi:MAG TPA: SUMF1/EgtB/PvdO family nonheme iron enzyme [Pyrinomonadaceae bacterium]
MKTGRRLLKLALITSALCCALAPPFRSNARQSEGRGLGIVSVRVEDGKEVRLYEKSYALVVGVSDYTHGWPKLPGVKKDIEEVARALERHGFLVTKVENPDSAQLDKSFKTFIDAYGRGVETRLLFYFAGHGHTIKQSYGEEMGYIVPADAPLPARDPSGFMSKAMDMQQMELYARRVQSKHALFLFDSCFSGAIFALSRAVPDAITYKTARPVRQFITSGSADEQVPDQSIFRRQFVEALDGEADLNRDGYVTGTELGEFLQDKVINYSRNTQHPQYGKLRNPNLDKGDFIFALPKPPSPVAVATAATPTPAPPASPKPGHVVRTRSGVELAYIPPGRFMMGSENGKANELPVREVIIPEGFYMGRYEVTQAQWQSLMGGDNPSRFKGSGDCPVDSVRWYDAMKFIEALNGMNDGYTYSLPTEAQWEYACRAGTKGDYAGDLNAMAWYADNSGREWLDAAELWRTDRSNYNERLTANGNRTHPVGRKQPNGFGLYDMHGNVAEWCQEWATSARLMGLGEKGRRVLRGGSWDNLAFYLRSASRDSYEPDIRGSIIGFRVVAVERR